MRVKSESEVAQSCPTLQDPMDHSLPGSSVHGIFQQEYWSGLPVSFPRYFEIIQISYFQLLLLFFSHSVMSNCLWPHEWKCARLPWSSLSPGVCSNLRLFESVMPFNHLILCLHLLLISVFLSIRDFSNESVFRTRWPKCWSFSFSISPSHEYSELIQLKLSQFHPLDCGFGLHFPGDEWCWAPFHVPVGHLDDVFGKTLSKCYLDPFLNWIILFLLLSCMSSLYIFL